MIATIAEACTAEAELADFVCAQYNEETLRYWKNLIDRAKERDVFDTVYRRLVSVKADADDRGDVAVSAQVERILELHSSIRNTVVRNTVRKVAMGKQAS